MSVSWSDIEQFPIYLWKHSPSPKKPLVESGLTLYLHRVQNIWHILYWMYTHEEYCKTGFYMAEYCVHVLMSKMVDLGEAEYHVLLKQLSGFHGKPPHTGHMVAPNNCHHTSGMFTDMIVSSFKESMSPMLLNLLKKLSNMKETEQHLGQVLSSESKEVPVSNTNKEWSGFEIFWEIVQRIKKTAFNIPSTLLDKCHARFATYLIENFDKMQRDLLRFQLV